MRTKRKSKSFLRKRSKKSTKKSTKKSSKSRSKRRSRKFGEIYGCTDPNCHEKVCCTVRWRDKGGLTSNGCSRHCKIQVMGLESVARRFPHMPHNDVRLPHFVSWNCDGDIPDIVKRDLEEWNKIL